VKLHSHLIESLTRLSFVKNLINQPLYREFLPTYSIWHGLCNIGKQERKMRSYLINKNLCLYYRLRKSIGKKRALSIANAIERGILMFGREARESPQE